MKYEVKEMLRLIKIAEERGGLEIKNEEEVIKVLDEHTKENYAEAMARAMGVELR